MKGTIKIIKEFYMKELNRRRTIRIYLPEDYEYSNKNYPVMYMHDGQNLFNKELSSFGMIWDVKTLMDKFYDDKKTDGIIVVGIDNGNEFRYDEYSPWRDEKIQSIMPHVKETGNPGGNGFLYGEFIVNTLKPYIDNNFRTIKNRENTSICGSSMGGLISLVIGLKYQNIFSKIGAFSSALFFAENDMMKFLSNIKKEYNMKIYMDVGTAETSNNDIKDFPKYYLESNKNAFYLLKECGFSESKEEIKFLIDEGARHNELEWNKRFPVMMDFLYFNN